MKIEYGELDEVYQKALNAAPLRQVVPEEAAKFVDPEVLVGVFTPQIKEVEEQKVKAEAAESSTERILRLKESNPETFVAAAEVNIPDDIAANIIVTVRNSVARFKKREDLESAARRRVFNESPDELQADDRKLFDNIVSVLSTDPNLSPLLTKSVFIIAHMADRKETMAVEGVAVEAYYRVLITAAKETIEKMPTEMAKKVDRNRMLLTEEEKETIRQNANATMDEILSVYAGIDFERKVIDHGRDFDESTLNDREKAVIKIIRDKISFIAEDEDIAKAVFMFVIEGMRKDKILESDNYKNTISFDTVAYTHAEQNIYEKYRPKPEIFDIVVNYEHVRGKKAKPYELKPEGVEDLHHFGGIGYFDTKKGGVVGFKAQEAAINYWRDYVPDDLKNNWAVAKIENPYKMGEFGWCVVSKQGLVKFGYIEKETPIEESGAGVIDIEEKPEPVKMERAQGINTVEDLDTAIEKIRGIVSKKRNNFLASELTRLERLRNDIAIAQRDLNKPKQAKGAQNRINKLLGNASKIVDNLSGLINGKAEDEIPNAGGDDILSLPEKGEKQSEDTIPPGQRIVNIPVDIPAIEKVEAPKEEEEAPFARAWEIAREGGISKELFDQIVDKIKASKSTFFENKEGMTQIIKDIMRRSSDTITELFQGVLGEKILEYSQQHRNDADGDYILPGAALLGLGLLYDTEKVLASGVTGALIDVAVPVMFEIAKEMLQDLQNDPEWGEVFNIR